MGQVPAPVPPLPLATFQSFWHSCRLGKQMHRSMWHAACSTDGGLDLWLMHIPQLVALVFLPLKWRPINSIDLAALASINGSCSCPRYLCPLKPLATPAFKWHWQPFVRVQIERNFSRVQLKNEHRYNECSRSVIHGARCLIGHSWRVKWTVLYKCYTHKNVFGYWSAYAINVKKI